jgi:hypothetical protein
MEAVNDALKLVACALEILKPYESDEYPDILEVKRLLRDAVDKLVI